MSFGFSVSLPLAGQSHYPQAIWGSESGQSQVSKEQSKSEKQILNTPQAASVSRRCGDFTAFASTGQEQKRIIRKPANGYYKYKRVSSIQGLWEWVGKNLGSHQPGEKSLSRTTGTGKTEVTKLARNEKTTSQSPGKAFANHSDFQMTGPLQKWGAEATE